MAAFGISGLILALLLWNVGRFAVLPPALMGTLFALATLIGLSALVPLGRPTRSGRRIGTVTGTLTAALIAAYLFVLFDARGGPVSVERRVAVPKARTERLRLVDFNVLHGYPRFADQEKRYRRLLAALEALEPTVVVVQESWSVVGHGRLAERLGADLGLDVAYARANGSRRLLGFEEGSAVLSRLPIIVARRIVLAPRRFFWESRVALLVEVQVGPAETLPVVGTHLTDRDSAAAAAQARHLAEALAPEELFAVAGDFNAPSGSAAVRTFEERGMVDVVPGGIDHVMVKARGGWRVANAERTLRPPELGKLIGESAPISDHPGILVDLVRPSGDIAAARRTAPGPRPGTQRRSTTTTRNSQL